MLPHKGQAKETTTILPNTTHSRILLNLPRHQKTDIFTYCLTFTTEASDKASLSKAVALSKNMNCSRDVLNGIGAILLILASKGLHSKYLLLIKKC
jgi:hypothetical protein